MDFYKGIKMKLLIEYTITPIGLLNNGSDIADLDKVLIGAERQRNLIGLNEFDEPIYEVTPLITLTEETVRDLKNFLST